MPELHHHAVVPSSRLAASAFRRISPGVALASVLTTCLLARPGAASPHETQTDLDAFMQRVLTRRDDNWKKLQQYILDERERIDLRGPARQAIWGEDREYTWYIRDGYFVRSPVKVNGVTIGESDRRKYEAEFLRRTKRREQYRLQGRPAEVPPPADAGTAPPSDLPSVIRQSREPEFITSAYFLRFKFEPGRYALVGHDPVAGRDLLRIEYYPARLFTHQQRRAESTKPEGRKAEDAELERMMNKVSLVTLWIDPSLHQIIKYTFENIDADFLPAPWLVRVGNIRASMTMAQAFPDVWLPDSIEASLGLTVAVGAFDVQYSLDYHNYRLPDVTSTVRIPAEK